MLIFGVMLNSSHWQHVKNIYTAVIQSVFLLSYRKLVKNPYVWLWNCICSFLTDVELKMPVKLLQNYIDTEELFSIETYFAKSNAKET